MRAGPALTLCLMLVLLPLDVAAQQVRQLLNGIRSENGLGPVVPSTALEQAAMAHAVDMAQQGFLGHVGSDGSETMARVRREGYEACHVAENIAQGGTSVTEVLGGWARSPGERENLLSPEVQEYGLVRATGDIWVLLLGRSNC
ncbi:CAP domain-containing protein [Tropicibacter sp. S64]|uniref:CAP domain-containing protein n=1 Tax=Tropicibacter sp. S64 TaxID=3415122 RepID=UPI003C7D7DF0